jgi:hypothetical protein
MKTSLAVGLLVLITTLPAAPVAGAAQEAPEPASSIQPVSWDAWLAAKAKAEKHDAEGDFVAALQYYLEYVRQAQGLNSPARVAWGKNNAAYMIIKMFRQDPTVDIAPARRLLEEGLAIPEAPEDCRRVMAMNLEYVHTVLRAPR